MERDDDHLLDRTPTEPEAFGEFYRRWSRSTVDGRSVYLFILPDGAKQVPLTLRGGGTLGATVASNGVLLGPATASSVSWTDANGVAAVDANVHPRRLWPP